MVIDEAAFLEHLRTIFKIEANEHLDILSQILTEADRHTTYRTWPEAIEQMYREAHSLKGAARSVNQDDIVVLCQGIEDIFSGIKTGDARITPQVCSLLLEVVDFCYLIIDKNPKGKSPGIDELAAKLAGVLQADTDAAVSRDDAPFEPDPEPGNPFATEQKPSEEPVQKTPATPDAPFAPEAPPAELKPHSGPIDQAAGTMSSPESETVRIKTSRLDELFQQAEDMIGLKTVIRQRTADLKRLETRFSRWKKSQAHPSFLTADNPLPGDGEPRRDSFITGFETQLMRLVRAMETDQRISAMMIDKLLKDVKTTLMQPFSSLLNTLPRQIRELGRSLGKEAELTIKGQDIEIDRRILEQIKVPLNHLIRNCVDHGIESPEERVKKNKQPRGMIHISVRSGDDKIRLELSDDGTGIDVSDLKNSAVAHHILDPESAAKLTDREALQLIFQSGISTSPLITDISGRGLGLSIVKEKLEQIHGSVHVESRPGKGTRFTLEMPLTLVTFQGVLTQVLDRCFIFPSPHVERVQRTAPEEIRTVDNRATIIFKERPIPLISLKEVLQIPAFMQGSNEKSRFLNTVVVAIAGRNIGFVVDDILGLEEVLAKPLGSQLARVKHISGATVLGNGLIVPILNVSDLAHAVVSQSSGFLEISAPKAPQKKSILVVEDSITARTLLKNIFQSAGYDVTTAVDGKQGFNLLQKQQFDLVVSDVEMPEMNGFELTKKIRSNEKNKDLPVVLVTSLASPIDRQRGMKAGASAYIVKSSLEQSSLLDVVERIL